MKMITKLRKADVTKKTDIWQGVDMLQYEREDIVKEMILSIPGHYKLLDRQYGTNLVDAISEMYGWMPSMLISQSMLLGMQATHPKKVYASFTLGLDAIEIKK